MIIANEITIARITGNAPYTNGAFIVLEAARVNQAVVDATGGKVPCYAIPGKRAAFKWVSVGSSCVISRGEAAKWLARYGADIEVVERAA